MAVGCKGPILYGKSTEKCGGTNTQLPPTLERGMEVGVWSELRMQGPWSVGEWTRDRQGSTSSLPEAKVRIKKPGPHP